MTEKPPETQMEAQLHPGTMQRLDPPKKHPSFFNNHKGISGNFFQTGPRQNSPAPSTDFMGSWEPVENKTLKERRAGVVSKALRVVGYFLRVQGLGFRV